MRWSEIKPDHVTAGGWLWYRPTSKNSDPLEVPLSSYAIQVLDELRPLTEHTGFVFPSQRTDGKTGYRSDSWKPVDRLRRASGVLDFANHAVRKTISTYLTRVLDVQTDVVTGILNHRLPGPKANENYIQALPVRRMREALEVWGKHLAVLAPVEREPAPGAVTVATGPHGGDQPALSPRTVTAT
jgi:integrase